MYGTDKSQSVKLIKDAGFNLIGITVIICEETFIFNTEEEAIKAHDYFEKNPVKDVIQGWWYGLEYFKTTREEYIKDFYRNKEEEAPIVYWIN